MSDEPKKIQPDMSGVLETIQSVEHRDILESISMLAAQLGWAVVINMEKDGEITGLHIGNWSFIKRWMKKDTNETH